ncbi:MAG: DUF2723 domain-containing protein [Chloroflexi bacterium]|nr:DUF2723 domain-containing protein [Chloroflexota bacterium]
MGQRQGGGGSRAALAGQPCPRPQRGGGHGLALPPQEGEVNGEGRGSRGAGEQGGLAYGLQLTAYSLVLYLLTLAPDLTQSFDSADGGELIAAAVTGGIPHPPGYPTYLLLGKLFSWLPWGTLAWRFNLLSAMCAAVGLGFTAATLRRHAPPHAVGAAVLALAATPLLWQQAIVTEVYTLNFAVLAALLWVLEGEKPRPFWVGLLWGISLTTHLTSVFWLLAVSYQLLANSLKLTANSLRLTAYGLFLGSLPWLILPLRGIGESHVMWGDPTTVAGWWWLVSAELYRPNVLAVPWTEIGARLVGWGTAALCQWAVVGWVLAGLGTWRILSRGEVLRGFFLFKLGLLLIYGLWVIDYAKVDSPVLLLPCLLLLSGSLAHGLASLGRAAWLLPLLLVALHYSSMATEPIRETAVPFLNELPPNTLLLTQGDEATFAMWYFHHAEGLRPDIIVVDTDLLAFDWYRRRLQRHYPTLNGLAQDDLATLVQQAERPIWHWELLSNPEDKK